MRNALAVQSGINESGLVVISLECVQETAQRKKAPNPSAVEGFASSIIASAFRAEDQRPSYSHRKTLADIAVQTTNVSTSAATSARCANHDSPFQIPSSSETAY